MNNEYEINDESWQAAKDIIIESVLSGNFSKNYEIAKGDFEYGLEERHGPNQEESIVEIVHSRRKLGGANNVSIQHFLRVIPFRGTCCLYSFVLHSKCR